MRSHTNAGTDWRRQWSVTLAGLKLKGGGGWLVGAESSHELFVSDPDAIKEGPDSRDVEAEVHSQDVRAYFRVLNGRCSATRVSRTGSVPPRKPIRAKSRSSSLWSSGGTSFVMGVGLRARDQALAAR